ncbi:RNA polymerase sigma factor [Streptomyces finlayi]|uniref:RNA polymerase sigma factor n=1 Tax=Streptomyces finlayi TaxID=67296 RepID=UPI001624496B|nr:sigma-70 family RNA polymerase sigma factor [Streptomyces finlayi]
MESAHRAARRAEISRSAAPGRPEEAFDALYAHAAHGLVHQAFLLTGHRTLAFESVEHAFRHAWEHWPEYARDPEPLIRVRAEAHEYALSPWHRFRRASRRPGAPMADVVHQALLALTPLHRRVLLLCDGLGLSVEQAAAETAASEPAARNRLCNARTNLEKQLRRAEDRGDLAQRLSVLALESSAATIPLVHSVRTGSDERLRLLTRVVFGMTAALIGVVACTATVSSTHGEPFNPGGSVVGDIRTHGGR